MNQAKLSVFCSLPIFELTGILDLTGYATKDPADVSKEVGCNTSTWV
jgi:hypothetical protein